jgi:hypothetical protein
MKRILILILIAFAAGCSNTTKNAGGGSGTSMHNDATASRVAPQMLVRVFHG